MNMTVHKKVLRETLPKLGFGKSWDVACRAEGWNGLKLVDDWSEVNCRECLKVQSEEERKP